MLNRTDLGSHMRAALADEGRYFVHQNEKRQVVLRGCGRWKLVSLTTRRAQGWCTAENTALSTIASFLIYRLSACHRCRLEASQKWDWRTATNCRIRDGPTACAVSRPERLKRWQSSAKDL